MITATTTTIGHAACEVAIAGVAAAGVEAEDSTVVVEVLEVSARVR